MLRIVSSSQPSACNLMMEFPGHSWGRTRGSCAGVGENLVRATWGHGLSPGSQPLPRQAPAEIFAVWRRASILISPTASPRVLTFWVRAPRSLYVSPCKRVKGGGMELTKPGGKRGVDAHKLVSVHGILVLVALWLIVSPFLLGYGGNPAA